MLNRRPPAVAHVNLIQAELRRHAADDQLGPTQTELFIEAGGHGRELCPRAIHEPIQYEPGWPADWPNLDGAGHE